MSDRLHDTLSALRTDVDHVPLADSSAVRARGTQRTRRQAVGTSLAVVALVAGVIGVSTTLTGTNKADDLPATRNTTTTAPDVTPPGPLGPSVLLAATELPAVPHQTFTVGETLAGATTADLTQRHLAVCQPAAVPAPRSAMLRTFPSDLDAFAWEWVASYGSAGEATTALAGLRDTCAAAKATIMPLGGLPSGGEGFQATKFAAPDQSEYHGELYGVVRVDYTIVVVGLTGMLKDGDVDIADFDVVVASSATNVASR